MTWIQTRSGRALDLLDPTPEMIDFREDVSIALAKTPRFAAQTSDINGIWAVSEHCVTGADWIGGTEGRRLCAAYGLVGNGAVRLAQAAFLMHDAHEYVITDIATPVTQAGDAVARAQGAPKGAVSGAIGSLKERLDAAIYRAAGRPWPLPQNVLRLVKLVDARLLITERNHLLARPPKSWGALENLEPLPMRGALKIDARKCPMAKADEWLERLENLCPAVHEMAAPATALAIFAEALRLGPQT